MKILVYEHFTSGALVAESLPNHLTHEGNIMLQTLLNDLAEHPGIYPIVLRDPRLSLPDHVHRCHFIHNHNEFRRHWLACLNDVDAVLPLAPETNGLLAEIQAAVLNADKCLLGCCPSATRIAASKILTMKSLAAAGLATIPTVWLEEWQPATFKAPLICKPDEGAGCNDVLYFETEAALNTWKQETSKGIWRKRIVQPYIHGTATSLCLLCANGKAWLVSGNNQHLKLETNTLHVTHLTINGVEIQQHRPLQTIADVIAQTLTGLWGFIGVDLILGPYPPIIVEINPRLTTSYVGLREAYGGNPATWLLTLLNQSVAALTLPPNPGWKVTVSVEANNAA